MAFSEDTATNGDITTDANFRAWVAAVRAAIVATGIVRTSDTGQIDTATVSAPATGAYAGYDIFRFDDAAQGSDPIYFKLEYGKGSATTRHALRLTAGTGSDGAGTISNAATAVVALGTATASGNTVLSASFFDGAFALWDAYSNAVSGQNLLVVERARDIEGDLIAGQFFTFGIGNGSGTGFMRAAGTWTSVGVPLPVTATAAGGGAMILGYFYFQAYPLFTVRSILLATSDIAQGDSGAVDVNGVSCTYKRPPTNGNQLTGSSSQLGLIRSG